MSDTPCPLVYDIRDLVKCYSGRARPANDHITLQIHRGEIFGLLGDNGAGKSTLVRQMANLLRSTGGRVSLFGQPLGADPLHVPRHVGYMPQSGGALNNLTVAEALYFMAHLRGLSRGEARAERDALLETWQLTAIRHVYSARLSGGQARLLQLAAAMAGSPPVLILDEPTANLDPRRRALVWDTLRRVNSDRGTTIIFITHDAIEAEKAIQRVGIMRAGALVALGRPADLKRQVDQQLRLELSFAPATPPRLPDGLTRMERAPGHWLILLDWEQVPAVLAQVRRDQVDDFRLYSATLEDLYLHYVTRS